MRDAVQRWLESGAEVQAGLRLLSDYAPNNHLARLVTLRPDKYKGLLVATLCKLSNAQLPEQKPAVSAPTAPRPRLREHWPFLSAPDCPPELKILAADKITAYNSYVEAHRKLFDCTSPEECFSTAEEVIKSFGENRKIFFEFTYYAEHHALLGQHPIFKEMRQMSELRQKGILGLIACRRNIEGAIWRVRHEIERGDKPHLDIERQQRLQVKQRELAAVNQMIEEYERTSRN